jgi:hypothetical protein
VPTATPAPGPPQPVPAGQVASVPPRAPQAPPARGPQASKRHAVPGRLVAVLLAVALGCGILTVQVARRGPDRAPFFGALVTLASAPEVHYRTTELDAHVTRNGELTGTVTQAGQEYGLLRVDGRLYVRPPDAVLRRLLPATQAAALSGRWLTGKTADALAGRLTAQLMPPAAFADRLVAALATARLPAQRAHATVVDGVAVLSAATPLGEIRVSRDAPYRLVRLDPPATGTGPGTAGVTAVSAVGLASVAEPASVAGPASGVPTAGWMPAHPARPAGDDAASASLGFPPEEPGDLGATYDRLLDSAAQLATADDTDVSFDFDGKPTVQCSSGGCRVTETITTDTSSDAPATLRGSATVRLTADITLNGSAAGSCTASATMPLNGSATLGCTDAEAGPRYQALYDELSADAQAEADATGQTAYYSIQAVADVAAYAVASVDAEKLATTLRSEAAEVPREGCGNLPPGARAATAGHRQATAAGRPGPRVLLLVPARDVKCRRLGHLDPGGRALSIPAVPGVYFIELNDGTMYIGMSESNIYRRIAKAFSSRKSAVNAAGYNHTDAASIVWSDMTGFSKSDIFKAEDDWLKLAESMHIRLHNRISSPGASLNGP